MTIKKASLRQRRTRLLETNAKPSVTASGVSTGFLDSRVFRRSEREPTARSTASSITQSIIYPIQGESVVFSAPDVPGQSSHQWYLDSTAIEGETSATYTRTILASDHGRTLAVDVTESGQTRRVTLALTVITYDIFFDPSQNVFQETSGAISGLTAAGDGDSVGTWADTSGTYILRAPSAGTRMTRGETSDGKAFLNRTVNDQHYDSDDAASTWAFLHDGTAYTLATAFAPSEADQFFTLLDTAAATGNNRGVWYLWDDRDSQSVDSAVKALISAGSLNRSVNSSDVTGVALGKWHKLVYTVDPDAASSLDRIFTYSQGRKSSTNQFTGTVSALAPANSLRVGGYNGAASSGGTGKIGCIIIYLGTWDASQVAAFNARFDLDAGSYSEQIRTVTVADTSFAKFPHLAIGNGGAIAVSYRVGSSHNSTDGMIYCKTSSDDGVSWSSEVLIADPPGRDAREATLFYNAENDLIAIITSRDDAPDTDYRLDIYASGDNGLTWSESLSTITAPSGYDYVFSNSAPALSSDGSFWLLSCYGTNTSSGDGTGLLYKSTNGFDWTFYAAMGNNSIDLFEPTVINTGGQNWLCVYRGPPAGAGIAAEAYVSTSTDDGLTWSNPVDQNVQGVQPKLFKVGNSYYCGITDRVDTDSKRCISIYPYYNGALQGGIHTNFVYEIDGAYTDAGHNSTSVLDGFIYLVFYDQAPVDGSTDAGVTFRKFRYPDIA